MLAMGRRPNTHGLGLEAAGVDLDALGAVVVDRFSQSSIDNVFAVGDVTNRLNLTPVAIREGHAFADSVSGESRRLSIISTFRPPCSRSLRSAPSD